MQSNRFLEGPLSRASFFFIVLFCQTAIKTALDTLPKEVLVRILNYIHPHYCEKLSIASALNQENYFGNSPHHILAGLGIKALEVLFSCKALYNKIPIVRIATQNYKSYCLYFAQHAEIFDITKKSKRIILKNLAFLFFSFSNKRICFKIEPKNPPFYEPFAFALTKQNYYRFEKNHQYSLIDNYPSIASQQEMFSNIALLNERLIKFQIPIEISIFMTNYFNCDPHYVDFAKKNIFEKILETTNDDQKTFVSFLKKNKSKINKLGLKDLFTSNCGFIKSDADTNMIINIVNFFLQYNLNFHYSYIINYHSSKNLITLLNLSNTFVESQECTDCANAHNIIIQQANNRLSFGHVFFCEGILESLLNIKNNCSHTLFNEKLADFIANHYPQFDYSDLFKIISFLDKNHSIKYELPYLEGSDFLKKNSEFFKNLLLLSQYTEQIHWNNTCSHCTDSKAALIKKCLKEAENNNESAFWNTVTREAFTIKKVCPHNLFDDNHIAFLKMHYPDLNKHSFLKIISFLSKTNSMNFICGLGKHMDILDKNSTVFKNLLYLARHYEEEGLRKKIDSLVSSDQSEWNYFLSTACHDWQNLHFEKMMGNFNCSCDQCTLIRNQTVPPLPKGDHRKIFLGAIGIVVCCIIILLIAIFKKGGSSITTTSYQ